MEEIPAFPDRLQVLNEILRKGIEELCQYAKKNDYLTPPYGRNPDPTPLITEEEFLVKGGLKCEDDEPPFSYEYGFDPLKFLADYLKWAHPDSVQRRLNDKLGAQERLVFRANHAKRQLQTQEYLVSLMKKLSSGIEWGPFTAPLSSSVVRCVVKPFKRGILYVQLSTEEDFQNIIKTYKLFYDPALERSGVSHDGEEGNIEAAYLSKSFDIINLQEKVHYFIRCFSLHLPNDASPSALLEGIPSFDTKLINSLIDLNLSEPKNQSDVDVIALLSSYSNINHFWTIPDPAYSLLTTHSHHPNLHLYTSPESFPYNRESLIKLQFFGQLPINQIQQRWDRIFSKIPEFDNSSLNDSIPLYSCFLGDIFHHSYYDEEIRQNIFQYYYSQINKIENNFTPYSCYGNVSTGINLTNSLLSSLTASLLIAWRDSNPQSSQLLKWEETVYKQYRHDLKKYNKKYHIDDGKSKKSKSSSSSHHGKGNIAGGGSNTQAHIPPPPVLKRPPVSPQLDALLQVLLFYSFFSPFFMGFCFPFRVILVGVSNAQCSRKCTTSTCSCC
jgi:hypothetical protein